MQDWNVSDVFKSGTSGVVGVTSKEKNEIKVFNTAQMVSCKSHLLKKTQRLSGQQICVYVTMKQVNRLEEKLHMKTFCQK